MNFFFFILFVLSHKQQHKKHCTNTKFVTTTETEFVTTTETMWETVVLGTGIVSTETGIITETGTVSTEIITETASEIDFVLGTETQMVDVEILLQTIVE